MKTPLLAFACLAILPLAAQTSEPRRPRISAPEPVRTSQDQSDLTENIVIHLEGTTTGNEIDLALTGVGPKFNADQLVGDNDSMLSSEYTVAKSEAGYRVSYVIQMRVKIATSVKQDSATYEFRDVILRGTVICATKRPVVLASNGGKTLRLTVSKETEAGK